MRRKVKIAMMSVVSVALAFVVTACGTQAGTPSSSGKKPLIGFSEVTESSPYYVELKDAILKQGAKSGFSVIFEDAHNSVSKENADVQDMLTRGIKLLIIDAANPQGVAPAIAAAKKANVPVIAVDRPISLPVTSFVGRDNQQMGHLVGEYAKQLIGGKGTIFEIQGAPGDLVMMARRKGFDSVFSGNANVKIVHSTYDYYERDKAIVSAEDFLASPHPHLKLIYAHNDDMAMGALKVLQEHHITNVDVVGIDGLMSAIKAIKDGTQYKATALNDPAYQGTVAVKVAAKVLAGKTVPKFVNVGTTLVTFSNAAKYYNAKLGFASYRPPVKF
ncbi:MAG: substrate-binding domain-containing protein [Peptococcaceae bacterium]|nr:substrate-binding domain-containing protein [Peptococcaceae bacterium]